MAALVLWDIDGTLIKGSRALVEAFLQALRTVYALEGELRQIPFGGMTDPQIVLDVLALHEIDQAVALDGLPTFSAHYYELATAAVDRLQREIIVLPGVQSALHAVDQAGHLQTLLTGNLEPTARLKLEAAGLATAFDWRCGAFGSDHRIRDQLVAIAQRKARQHGLVFDRTVVIGDTPRDVQCARAGGAAVIAVATGSFSVADLAACAPDVLLADLSDTQRVCNAITGSVL